MTQRVGVITVSYGSGEHLAQMLQSLRQHCGDDVQVMVVDNKPDHDAVADVAEKFGVHYLPLPANPGYGAGMNAGGRALEDTLQKGESFDAFFVVNPDVTFVEDSISALGQVLNSDEHFGAVGPTLLDENGDVYPSARAIPSVGTGVGHALFGTIWPSNPWTRAYKTTEGYAEQRNSGWLSGAAVMVKAKAWHEIGGFDEAYFLNFEDIDLGFRLGKAGYLNIYTPETRVVHTGGHSLDKHEAVSEHAMHESAQRFMRKRYAGFWNTPVRWAVVLGLKVRGALKQRALKRQQTV